MKETTRWIIRNSDYFYLTDLECQGIFKKSEDFLRQLYFLKFILILPAKKRTFLVSFRGKKSFLK